MGQKYGFRMDLPLLDSRKKEAKNTLYSS